MAETLEQYAKRIRKYTVDRQRKDILKIVGKHEDQLVDANTLQLMDGKDSNDEPLAPYRDKNYAELKLHLNPKGVTDLNLTGDFHKSFFVRVDKFPISIWAKDAKTNKLVGEYGEDIFGVSKRNLERVKEQGINQDIESYYDFLRVQ